MGLPDTKYLKVWEFSIERISAATNGYLIHKTEITCTRGSYLALGPVKWCTPQESGTFCMSYWDLYQRLLFLEKLIALSSELGGEWLLVEQIVDGCLSVFEQFLDDGIACWLEHAQRVKPIWHYELKIRILYLNHFDHIFYLLSNLSFLKSFSKEIKF